MLWISLPVRLDRDKVQVDGPRWSFRHPQGPTWSEFLSVQAKVFVIKVQSRLVSVLGVTTNPNGARVTQLARNFASDLEDAANLLSRLDRR